jgi:O-glycosyl hydrolase
MSDAPAICDVDRPFQFGAAFTDASIVLGQYLTNEQLLQSLQPLSVLRISIGPSDFSAFLYDWEEVHPFEVQTKFPFLSRVQKLRPDITWIASIWSPPARFKKDDRLNSDLLAEYANVVVKHINSAKASGAVIHFIALQNEPLFHTLDYPSCRASAKDLTRLASLVKEQLPLTKLLAFDHNPDKEGLEFISSLRESESVWDALAIHTYQGNVESLSRYRALPIYHTEICPVRPEKASVFDADPGSVSWHRKHIQEVHEIGSQTYIFWNLFLDEIGGPTIRNWRQARPLVWVLSDGRIQFTGEWHLISEPEMQQLRVKRCGDKGGRVAGI